jgi:hypothetical protein
MKPQISSLALALAAFTAAFADGKALRTVTHWIDRILEVRLPTNLVYGLATTAKNFHTTDLTHHYPSGARRNKSVTRTVVIPG